MNPNDKATEVIIKRHPFGLVALYLQVAIGLGIALGLVYFLVPGLLDGDAKTKALHYLNIFSAFVVALAAIFLLIGTYIYRRNQWTVSDESISQLLQRGLFNRQISELSMANIEDVTAEQKGILAMLFGFGTLRCETAGELPYFHFNYCPKPNDYARLILAARQRYIENDPTAAKRSNPLLDTPRQT